MSGAEGVRQPRARVLAAGFAVPGVMAIDVFANNHLAADRFRVRFAASVVDAEMLRMPGLRLDVQVGLDDVWTSLVVGVADALTFDPIRGVLEVEGRDLSAALIEARVGETFSNRTASEIVAVVAGRHGLGAEVTPTSTPVGRYYQSGHDQLTLGQFARATTEWDLLAFLAGQEGFDLFMEGERLRFGPSGGTPAVLRVEDCVSLELEHALGLSRPIAVTVRSWGSGAGAAVTHTAKGGGADGTAWAHVLVRPNLDAGQAKRLAERALADLVRHERTATASMPGELGLSPRRRVRLVGAGPGWDREYAVVELSRHVDVRRGFTQRLRLVGV